MFTMNNFFHYEKKEKKPAIFSQYMYKNIHTNTWVSGECKDALEFPMFSNFITTFDLAGSVTLTLTLTGVLCQIAPRCTKKPCLKYVLYISMLSFLKCGPTQK